MRKSLIACFVINALIAFNIAFDISEKWDVFPAFIITALVLMMALNLFCTKNNKNFKWLYIVGIIQMISYIGIYITGIFVSDSSILYIIDGIFGGVYAIFYLVILFLDSKLEKDPTDSLYAFGNLLQTPFLSYLFICIGVMVVSRYYNSTYCIFGYILILYFMYRIINKYIHKIKEESIFVRQVVIDVLIFTILTVSMVVCLVLFKRYSDTYYYAGLISLLSVLPFIIRLFYIESQNMVAVSGNSFDMFNDLDNTSSLKDDAIDAEVTEKR